MLREFCAVTIFYTGRPRYDVVLCRMPDFPLLDPFDRAILEILQRNARTTGEEIGARIGLSAAAIQRRVKRLRESRVIVGEVAVVDPLAAGQAMTFIVGIELERERSDMLDDFRRAARAEPSIQQCYYVTGSVDFVIIVTARNMADFEAFTRRLLYDNSNIRRFSTNVVMARDKVSLLIPIADAPNVGSSSKLRQPTRSA